LRHLEDGIAYDLVRPIAEGGMGRVYEAQQKGAGGFTKRVAIKVIREEYSNLPAFRKNFVGEAKVVSDLIHTCVVQTYHLGLLHGQYYMVMEYVDGVNLEEFMLQHAALGEDIPVDWACFIISRVCRGLSYAHQKVGTDGRQLGIVHRDINPRNIMLSFEGDVKITDFGIAKAVDLMYNEEGEIIAGKDEYLSPEQANREITDARADLFSCGVVLAEMLCGENPFEVPGNGPATRRNILEMPLPHFAEEREELTDQLVQILVRALARDKRHRYQSAAEMLTALEEYLYGDHYGPTCEKFAIYLKSLFVDGKAYTDDLNPLRDSFGLSVPSPKMRA
jgi:serine/threonine-protein kinase